MSERLNVKGMFTEPEKGSLPTLETVTEKLEPFLRQTIQESWNYSEDQIRIFETNLKVQVIKPTEINWLAHAADKDPSLAGQYTLNPETLRLNFDVLDPSQVKIIEGDEFAGGTFTQAAQYVVNTYGKDYQIPGLEYWQYVLEHPDRMPEIMKADRPDKKWGDGYYMFGSLVRDEHGVWRVPGVIWNTAFNWFRTASVVNDQFGKGNRIVLIKRQPSPLELDEAVSLPTSRNF